MSAVQKCSARAGLKREVSKMKKTTVEPYYRKYKGKKIKISGYKREARNQYTINNIFQ